MVSQLISTELMLTPETPAQQKWMMRAMPIIFVAFLYNFPSGLFVYWITTNLWTIGQTGIVRYLRAHHPVELKAADPNAPRKRSRFMDAMTAAQEQPDRQARVEAGRQARPAAGRQEWQARAASARKDRARRQAGPAPAGQAGCGGLGPAPAGQAAPLGQAAPGGLQRR